MGTSMYKYELTQCHRRLPPYNLAVIACTLLYQCGVYIGANVEVSKLVDWDSTGTLLVLYWYSTGTPLVLHWTLGAGQGLQALAHLCTLHWTGFTGTGAPVQF